MSARSQSALTELFDTDRNREKTHNARELGVILVFQIQGLERGV